MGQFRKLFANSIVGSNPSSSDKRYNIFMKVTNSLRGQKIRAKGKYVIAIRRGRRFIIVKTEPRLNARQ